LVDWYNSDTETHPLVKCALFAYDCVSIHPFQDGNGRLSRLISSLLLLKQGYKWIQYVSFEHEIESRKSEYYRVLHGCQANRPNEDVSEWIRFFFDALSNIQNQLMKKLETKGIDTKLSPRDKSILTFISNNAGCKSGEISKKLGIPSPTVKRILPELININLIEKHGTGPGTNYSINDSQYIEWFQVFKLGSDYVMVYECFDNESYSIALANSKGPDRPFTKSRLNPVLSKTGIAGAFDEFHVATGSLYFINGSWILYYCGAFSDASEYGKSRWHLGAAYLGLKPEVSP